jgi:hypothetical protein
MTTFLRPDILDNRLALFVHHHAADEDAFLLFQGTIVQKIGWVMHCHPEVSFDWTFHPALHNEAPNARRVPVYHLEYVFSNGMKKSFMLYVNEAGKITYTYELDPWVDHRWINNV